VPRILDQLVALRLREDPAVELRPLGANQQRASPRPGRRGALRPTAAGENFRPKGA